ncbi:M13 family metallopeptidase [Gaetbulibacter aestuarii]|uniref:M13 family metallopeptidase n=1 Tax=Gaetbulibacter aestuarii TaxID=1502358 RepID=A0ABW7MX74_9FLAO
MKKIAPVLASLLLIVACSKTSEKQDKLISGIDTSLNPGDNFFRYVNHEWYDTVQIPKTQTGVGAYRFMNYQQRLKLQGLLDSISQINHPLGSIEQKVSDFYISGLDTATINELGYKPVKPLLTKIGYINNVHYLLKYVIDNLKVNSTSLISFNIGPDQQNSNMNIAHVSQSGIGLPDRDYYFKTDSATVRIQKAYKHYLATLFELTDHDADSSNYFANVVYDIEKQLAESHKTRVERRNVKTNYHKMAVTDLEKRQPNLEWSQVLRDLGAKTDSLDMRQMEYYDKLNTLLPEINISDWRIYLKAASLRHFASKLSEPFTDANFEYSKVLTGQNEKNLRKETIASAVDNYLGEALGQVYVKAYFPESTKVRMEELVNNLQEAYAKRIDNLEWMTDSTKQKAKEKLFAITKKIGYPDTWKDYGYVHVFKDTYFENVISADAARYLRQLKKLGQPVDKTEWFVTPSTVTAYNNPSANEIVFPAGILQPPYFDNTADDALNYGGIGMVIGHEITHTFDDQGAQYDKDGNVKNWWTDTDYDNFKERIQQVIDQYSGFTVLDSIHVNGAMCVGENTADIAGVAVAYDAFKMTKEGQDSTKIDGYTPDQRFFLSIANIWRVKMTDDYLRYWINTNPHSPPKWRVNGPLMNTTPFYEAFHLKPQDSMFLAKKDRITIW